MHLLQGSRDGSFGTAIRLQTERSGNQDSIQGSGRDFSPLQSGQTGSGSHQASHAMGTKCFVPGVKRPKRESKSNIHLAERLIRRAAP